MRWFRPCESAGQWWENTGQAEAQAALAIGVLYSTVIRSPTHPGGMPP